jgi:peptidoglycan/LPS O-acetylase OafA/YrhL
MILGYDGPSIFSTLAASTHYLALSSMSVSMDPPLWTLHAEFWGSMLLVALAKLYRTLGRRAFWTMFVVALLVTGTSYFTLFLLGFAAYWSRHFFLRRRNTLSITLGVVAIACGILTATTIDNTYFADAMNKASHIMWFHSDDAHQFQSEVGATLTMLGMLLLPASRSLLSMRIPLWLGKVSFSLYLIHFPILFTVGFAVFNALLEQLSYISSVLLTALIVGSFTLICAACFERWVDRPAVAFARRIAMRPPVERAKTPV